MLFHVTIGHPAQDCPGRRPTEPPALVAPSDTRDALGGQLGVKLHFVLWGAACMLWAQPDHLAFAVLEAEDVESALQYVGAFVPQTWTYNALPVWNLPSQLRLIRQVRLAPPMHFGEVLTSAESPAESPAPSSRPARAANATPPPAAAPATDTRNQPSPGPTEAAPNDDQQPQAAEPRPPSTITRLLRELESPSAEVAELPSSGRTARPAKEHGTSPALPTQIEQIPDQTPEAVRAWLVATAGPTKGKTYPIPLDGATVGRLPEQPVYIPDERLSREHARIEFRGGQFIINDLGSRNGTALNGKLLSHPQALTSGDTIELGSSTLVITIEAPPKVG